MFQKKFAAIGGILVLAMGIFTLFPGATITLEELLPLELDTHLGHLVGFLPTLLVKKIATIGFGPAGIPALRARVGAACFSPKGLGPAVHELYKSLHARATGVGARDLKIPSLV